MSGGDAVPGGRFPAFRWLVAAPTMWLAHFLASYVTAAMWCARAAEPAVSLAWARAAVASYTLAALAGIGVLTLLAARWTADDDELRRFVGRTMVPLSGLSAVAVLYVALTAVFVGTCR